MHKPVLAFTFAISLSYTGFANARTDQSECQEAIGRYSRASREISEFARIYDNCIWNSRGHNDCSSEFSSLRDAQDDYRKECRQS